MVSSFSGRRPEFRCPECGSDDVELTRSGADGRMDVFQKMLDLLPGGSSQLQGGQYTLVCRKCGRRSVVFIR